MTPPQECLEKEQVHMKKRDDVRKASSLEQALLAFFQSTYEAGARLAHWDREALERRAR